MEQPPQHEQYHNKKHRSAVKFCRTVLITDMVTPVTLTNTGGQIVCVSGSNSNLKNCGGTGEGSLTQPEIKQTNQNFRSAEQFCTATKL